MPADSAKKYLQLERPWASRTSVSLAAIRDKAPVDRWMAQSMVADGWNPVQAVISGDGKPRSSGQQLSKGEKTWSTETNNSRNGIN